MYRTVEERLNWLEQTVERQAFQIELLQKICGPQNGLYALILASNMSRQCFLDLQALTTQFESYVESGRVMKLYEFITAFEGVLQQHGARLPANELADLIPAWLRGTNGKKGFSAILHAHFYS